ncbi:tetratricopeptide repeat protein [Thalassotalea fusca]
MTHRLIAVTALTFLFLNSPVNASEHTAPDFSVLTKQLCVSDECKKNYQKLKKFAKHGSMEAQMVVATAYLTGNGLEKNPKRAAMNLKKAKSSGSARAAWTLSYLYTHGIGVDKDLEEAEELFQYALDKNFGPALYQKATEMLDLTTKNNAEAILLLKTAIAKSDKESTYLLAQMYELGEGVEQNTVEAVRLYSTLKFFDYKDSQKRLQELLTSHAEDPEIVQLNKELDLDIEVITVSGMNWNLDNTLSTLVENLDMMGNYYGGGIGRIRGKGCVNSSSVCSSVTGKEEIALFMKTFR